MFYQTVHLQNPVIGSSNAINALSTAFGEQLENKQFLVSKLRISTYIRDKLEQTLNGCLMPTKLISTCSIVLRF